MKCCLCGSIINYAIDSEYKKFYNAKLYFINEYRRRRVALCILPIEYSPVDSIKV